MEDNVTDTGGLGKSLGAISRRLAAASPAPWLVERDAEGSNFIHTDGGNGRALYVKLEGKPAGDPDVEFIAASRNFLPGLVAELEASPSMLLSRSELSELTKLSFGASPSPWIPFLESEQPIGGPSFIRIGGSDSDKELYVWLNDLIAPDSDIDFIAHAR